MSKTKGHKILRKVEEEWLDPELIAIEIDGKLIGDVVSFTYYVGDMGVYQRADGSSGFGKIRIRYTRG